MDISPQHGAAQEYQLVRSKRKTMAIHITAKAEVVVRAPMRLPQRVIDAFVQKKSGWIEGHLTEMQKRIQALPNAGFEGLLLGKKYPVQRGGDALFDGERFVLPEGDEVDVLPAAEALYRKLAAALIAERVAHYGARMGLTPLCVKINGAKGRWGSCSSKNSLNFSWRLVLAPIGAVDYVVVHELSHMLHHNHSTQFWQAVAEVLPDYKQRKALLTSVHAEE